VQGGGESVRFWDSIGGWPEIVKERDPPLPAPAAGSFAASARPTLRRPKSRPLYWLTHPDAWTASTLTRVEIVLGIQGVFFTFDPAVTTTLHDGKWKGGERKRPLTALSVTASRVTSARGSAHGPKVNPALRV
jgi:hypothetical protein